MAGPTEHEPAPVTEVLKKTFKGALILMAGLTLFKLGSAFFGLFD
jgi:hypothetical protein